MKNHLDERYFNDPHFRTLVDHFYAAVSHLNSSFSEIREAALYAQLRWEFQNPRSIQFSPQLQAELEFRMGKR